ncbi:MAG: LysR substrate-binding domain-containing protein [Devosia sp.]
MNLRQLDYLLAVARTGSFTAAAGELGVAQPTLTKSIRGLEQELGTTLFERLPRGVELTQAGAVLMRHAERVALQVKDAGEEVAALSGGESGTVTIGAGPAWLRRHLPQAVARLVTRHPAVRVHVVGGFDDMLLKALRSGEVDFVVAELPSPEMTRDLSIDPLSADGLGACCRARHPLVGQKDLPLRALLDFPWVMPPHRTRAQRRLNALFVSHDLPPPTIVCETESMAFLLQMLSHSDALTFTVSTTLLAPEAAGLRMLDVPALAARREAGVITRRDGWLNPAAREVIAELRAICVADPMN